MSARHFLVLGLGSIGRRHATNLAALHPGARLTFVRHTAAEDDFTRSLGARVVDRLDAVIEDPIDLAVLATPSANHRDALPALIERACPLLVEKPVVTSLDDADAVSRLLETAPPAVRAAGFNLRQLPSLSRFRDAVAGGRLGTPVRASFIAGQWLPSWRPGTDYRSSYSSDASRGGGVELDLSHEFDVARWFFGDLAVEYARGGRLTSLELEANDTSVSVLAPATGPAPVVTVSLDYVARQRVRWYEVVGEDGRIEWSLDGRLELSDSTGRHDLSLSPSDFDVAATYVEMIRGVIDAATTGATSGFQSLEDGLASTRLALQVRDRGGQR